MYYKLRAEFSCINGDPRQLSGPQESSRCSVVQIFSLSWKCVPVVMLKMMTVLLHAHWRNSAQSCSFTIIPPAMSTNLWCVDFCVSCVLLVLYMPLFRCCKCLPDRFKWVIHLVINFWCVVFTNWCVSVREVCHEQYHFPSVPFVVTALRKNNCLLCFVLSLLSIKAFFYCQWRG